MTMRSTPPASSHFAEMPVPAPAPTIGRPASILERSRLRISVRVMPALQCYNTTSGDCGSSQHPQQQLDGLPGELRIVDVAVELNDRNIGTDVRLDRVEHRLVRIRVPEL